MSFPVLKVEVDFHSPPLSIPTNWTDLSERIRGLGINQGRQRLLSRTEASGASVLLDNRDRFLDPTFVEGAPTSDPNIAIDSPTTAIDSSTVVIDAQLASTNTSPVRPANHIRIQAVHNGATYDLFRGYVRGWPQSWPGYGFDNVSQVQAEDLFALLARYELEGQAIDEMGSGDHIAQVLSLYGWPLIGTIPPGKDWWQLGSADSKLGTNTYLGESLRFLEQGTAIIMATTLEGNLLDHLLNVAETTEGGLFYIAPSGEVTFTQRASIFAPSIGVWGDAQGEHRYVDLEMSYDDEEIFNDIRLNRRDDSTVYMASDETSVQNYGPRTLSVPDTLFSTAEAAQSKADELNSRLREPVPYPTRMVMRPRPDDPIWQTILGIKIGTKITVRRRPGGGGLIDLDCLILGVNYTINPDAWEITWDLAPMQKIFQGYWYLGVSGRSELGDTTKLA